MTTFTVYGLPATQGSKSIGFTKDGRAFLRESSARLTKFRKSIAASALAAGIKPRKGEVGLRVHWTDTRPTSHLRKRTANGLAPNAPTRPGRYDQDKILRAVCDALTGVAYADDRQVRAVACSCAYADDQVVRVTVFDLQEEGEWTYER